MWRNIVGGLVICALLMVAPLSAAGAAKTPPLAAPNTWTGFYVGGNLGYGWLQTTASDAGFSATGVATFGGLGSFVIPFSVPGTGYSGSNPTRGIFGGGQFGYNVQFGAWVIGEESDWQLTHQQSNAAAAPITTILPPGIVGYTLTSRDQYQSNIDWFGTTRARLGYVVNGLLFYGTAGIAFGQVSISGSGNGTATACFFMMGPPCSVLTLSGNAFAASKMNAGWAAGGGLEGAIGVSRWTWKAEYLHIDLGSLDANATTTTGIVPVQSRFFDDLARLGLNYRF